MHLGLGRKPYICRRQLTKANPFVSSELTISFERLAPLSIVACPVEVMRHHTEKSVSNVLTMR